MIGAGIGPRHYPEMTTLLLRKLFLPNHRTLEPLLVHLIKLNYFSRAHLLRPANTTSPKKRKKLINKMLTRANKVSVYCLQSLLRNEGRAERAKSANQAHFIRNIVCDVCAYKIISLVFVGGALGATLLPFCRSIRSEASIRRLISI